MRAIGSWGERIAADHLRGIGYRILAMNWRAGRYEIDLVAEHGRTVAFVEVKTRSLGPQEPAEAVDRRKRRHIARAAATWIATRSSGVCEFRFDVISVTILDGFTHRIEHMPGAFTADDT